MNKLCRQVSIETPSPSLKECVFNLEVPVPDVPVRGARIKVVCAGACYRNRNRSSSCNTPPCSEEVACPTNYYGVRDAALFPGFEVSGVIDELGADVTKNDGFAIGQRVVLFPYDDIPHGYSEFIVVPDLSFLVPVPDNVPLSVAAMLPTGALLANNAVLAAHEQVMNILKAKPDQLVKILIIGTGGLALWALRIASYLFKNNQYKDRVKVTVATLRDEGFKLQELKNINLVQWNEDLYEKQIIERTKDACNGYVDIVIDFGSTARSLQRSLQCLNQKGVVLVNEEVVDRLLPKFAALASDSKITLQPIAKGDKGQLKELVQCVSTGQIVPPPHSEFSADDASVVMQKLCKSEIPGRAILRFHDIH